MRLRCTGASRKWTSRPPRDRLRHISSRQPAMALTRGRAGLGVLLPGSVDGPPGVLPERIVGLLHETARLRKPHGPCLVAKHHLAGERARELVVETAPRMDPVLGERGREGLLLDAEQLVPAPSGVLDGEPGGGGSRRRRATPRPPPPRPGPGTATAARRARRTVSGMTAGAREGPAHRRRRLSTLRRQFAYTPGSRSSRAASSNTAKIRRPASMAPCAASTERSPAASSNGTSAALSRSTSSRSVVSLARSSSTSAESGAGYSLARSQLTPCTADPSSVAGLHRLSHSCLQLRLTLHRPLPPANNSDEPSQHEDLESHGLTWGRSGKCSRGARRSFSNEVV